MDAFLLAVILRELRANGWVILPPKNELQNSGGTG